MTLAALLIPPSLDAKQALRLRRLGLAALTYALTLVLVAIAWSFDVMPGQAALQIAAMYLVINLGLYAAIRSGLNLRCADPSLTRVQILIAITVVMFIVYHLDNGRDMALSGCFIVYLFGAFRLSAREFRPITLYTLAAYALVVNLLLHLRPETIDDVRREWLSWLLLAGFLPVFTLVGGQVNALRRKLRDSMQQLRLFADNVPAMTAYLDTGLVCRFASKEFAGFYGHAVEDVVGKHLREIIGAENFRDSEGYAAQAMQGQPVIFQRSRPAPNGETRHLEFRLLPHVGEQGKVMGCFGVTIDITGHKLAQERLEQVAHHDGLTGLPNRTLFNDRLQQAISLARRDSRAFALLFLDLNRFKQVNDTLGHAAGDELLQQVAARILRQVRESDTVARIGGDEFTVILHGAEKRAEAQIVCRKIVNAVEIPFRVGSNKQEASIGVSIGIALYPADAQDAEALVRVADAAMYSAKQA